MNRREFVKLITGSTLAAAGMSVLDPEMLLYKPGARTFFLPSAPVVLAPQIVSGAEAVDTLAYVMGRYRLALTEGSFQAAIARGEVFPADTEVFVPGRGIVSRHGERGVDARELSRAKEIAFQRDAATILRTNARFRAYTIEKE